MLIIITIAIFRRRLLDLDDDQDEIMDDFATSRALNQRIMNRILEFGYSEIDNVAFPLPDNNEESSHSSVRYL